jgi:hypothetical protein
MASRRGWFAGLLTPALVFGCGTGGGANYSLDVGNDDGGPSFGLSGGDGGQGAFDAYIENSSHVAIRFITLSCSGSCATVQAVGTGGYPPYTFQWDDGSTTAIRQVCPTSITSYSVKVTDTGTSGELARAPETIQVPLATNAIACDGGVPVCEDGGPSGGTPAPGHYVGSVYCPPDGGVLSLPAADGGTPSTGTITLDFALNGQTVDGSFYFLWSPSVIALQSSLTGTLDCATGGLRTTLGDGVWGLPGPSDPDGGMTVIQSGTIMGSITASPVSGSPGTITGILDYTTAPQAGFCLGTFAATLQP